MFGWLKEALHSERSLLLGLHMASAHVALELTVTTLGSQQTLGKELPSDPR